MLIENKLSGDRCRLRDTSKEMTALIEVRYDGDLNKIVSNEVTKTIKFQI
jgi:hypothetical protein